MTQVKKLFVVTLGIAGILFLLGMLIGFKIDDWRADVTQDILEETKLAGESFMVQSEFSEAFGLDVCDNFEPKLNVLSKGLFELGTKLKEYDLKNMQETEEFELIKRKHFLFEISTLALHKRLIEECGDPGINIIYFYSVDQDKSLQQGYALDKFVERFDNVHVFSFDYEFDEPALELLKQYYNITSTPTIVFDFVDKREGFVSLGELIELNNER